MDVSKEYIKMCEKATEVQDIWLHRNEAELDSDLTEGDVAYIPQIYKEGHFGEKQPGVYIIGNDHEYDLSVTDEEERKNTGAIWLPRQDQLQEMVALSLSPGKTMAGAFGRYVDLEWDNRALPEKYPTEWEKFRKHQEYWGQFTSMEQLWLAFVMDMKYHKSWNGTDWVKE